MTDNYIHLVYLTNDLGQVLCYQFGTIITSEVKAKVKIKVKG